MPGVVRQWHSGSVVRAIRQHLGAGRLPAVVAFTAVLLWLAPRTVAAEEAPGAAPVAGAGAGATLAWITGLTTPPAEVHQQRLLQMLEAGQPDAITDAIVTALSSSDEAAVVAVLRAHTHHRRVAVRLLAYGAIARMASSDANRWLVEGLRDADPLVRGLSARALGERGARAQARWLLLALERGVDEAAVPVGTLAPETALPRVHALLRHAELSPLLDGYGAWLARPDIELGAKLDILARLEEVAGPEVAAFLGGLVGSDGLPAGRLRDAAQSILRRVGAGVAGVAAPTKPRSAQ